MDKQSQKKITLTAPAEAGTFDVVALSDPRAQIHETNRDNNRRATTLTVNQPVVEPEAGFDVGIGDIAMDVIDWSKDTLIITATIWNGGRVVPTLWTDCNVGSAKGITMVTGLQAWEKRRNILCFVPLADLDTVGEVPFSMVADPSNLLGEQNRSNNTLGWNIWVPQKPGSFDLATGYAVLEDKEVGKHVPASITLYNGFMDLDNLSVTCSLGSGHGAVTVTNLVSWEEREVTCVIDATNVTGNQVHDFQVCAHPNDANPANDCQGWREWVTAP
ncbi:MAG: hypothetical protein KC736_00445 [Candidatus Moranbacteria bacterium]|nr:hypothetical protein [Candidatus Moranbacteria bacterium]